jgi:hypothetical protein
MRTSFTNHQKGGMFFIILGLLIGFGALLLSQQSWAAAKDPGNTTLCADTANRNVGTGSSDNISAGEKVKTGSKPLFLSFQTTVSNGLTFTGNTAELTAIQAPAGCTLSNITANVVDGCLIKPFDSNDSHDNGVKVNFTCTGGPASYNLGDPALTPADQNAKIFAAANAILGLGIDLSDCNVVNTPETIQACASAICYGIQHQLTNGDTKALSTAADLGTLIGSMQTTLDRCFASSSVVQYVGAGATCTPDQIAAATAYDVLLHAPEEAIQVESIGDGTNTDKIYKLSVLSGALGNPGDFAQMNWSTCTATFSQ